MHTINTKENTTLIALKHNAFTWIYMTSTWTLQGTYEQTTWQLANKHNNLIIYHHY
ncbi:hypothetical protein LX64_04427 [Chitinophaga skermanii]|uniref:Uncharacterized protein n=1 Tax=Chitinophaga skermanii TaxID=331697 RepID=A0A327Q7M0_9BACT|nr:hypothetical protein LX64_04427 [Chitinophaga skermanii]